MSTQFTANVYCKEERIATQTGNDIDKLYAWMLIQVNDNFNEIRGEIVDNKTNKIVRTFRKAPIE
ncbi:hypothetical protein OQJ18_06580 [Fluoribacter dumoffii]|uniref:Uncharacterized protein n=1 Tax=Fluoribacter dumoffii TaxID=463 RepID=A0A377G953_9GAMM|nr:hypothetical protein [Fluoribacter dumoffii]KTC89892.1 hypothetical protein Ldum_0960 [Fluoribacter dumoffii NY 23]MCW8385190.1 hypothetical protein [Fluoribacter dumoffii]MCW8418244.1 hypothetical protein [Fluoribacter dumoffii]MCW8453914.1 hypothetical protein [Fluoribacter dumoffii]MCW8462015.1 hypothetical protein [Fluoribacter dumoffii]